MTTKKERIAALEQRHRELQDIIDSRAADPTMQAVPGGSTGLIKRTTITFEGRDGPQSMDQFVFDAELMAEMLSIEKKVAIEMGQWPG